MATETVDQLVARLAQPGPLDAERIATELGTTLSLLDTNPDWTFYTFALPRGPFAGGVLRLSTDSAAALLTLSPRDPPGLTEAEVEQAAWGPPRSAVTDPRLPPKGADLLTYQLAGLTLTTLWTQSSRRLINLALERPEATGTAEESQVDPDLSR
jgi:hypothetical protein